MNPTVKTLVESTTICGTSQRQYGIENQIATVKPTVKHDDNIGGSEEDDKSNGIKQRPWPVIGPQCPMAAQKNVGLFGPHSNSSAKDNFRNVILLVACNYAYYDLLQNWEHLAKEHDLQWAVLALDEELYNFLGPERAISPEGRSFSVSGPQPWRQGDFRLLSCHKKRMVMSVAENCGMDIVFTDVDNIIYENPFEDDLGRLIESQRYDYIYQSNDMVSKPLQDQCLHGKPPGEGNSGFYFLSQNSKVMKALFNLTLERCYRSDAASDDDDQTGFWKELWLLKDRFTESNRSFHHCDLPEYLEPSTHNLQAAKNAAFNFCCLDPYYYPIGHPENNASKTPVTFHANFCIGKENKIEKLRLSRSDHHGWDESRIQGVEIP